jgi:hypothetical protein
MATTASSVAGTRSFPVRLFQGLATRWFRFLALFRTGSRYMRADPASVFEKIDVDGLKKQLLLAEQASRLGSAGLPPPGAVELDGPQRQIKQHLQTELAEGFRRTNTRLSRLWSALRARDVSEMVHNLETLPERRSRQLDLDLQQLRSELGEESKILDRTERDLAEYRERYRVRLPELKSATERRNLLSITIGLALLQALANTIFFAQGAMYGLSAGLVAAAVLGFFDVWGHLMGGRFLSRIRAPEWGNRAIGVGLGFLLLTTVPVWNLGMVHLRNGVRLHGFTGGTEQWLTSLLAAPLGFTDFYSWALLSIGVVCSVSAVITGWNWDEPIPRLRVLGRRLEESRADVADLELRIAELQQEAAEQIRQECEQERARIQHNLNVSEGLFREIQSTHENLIAYVQDARQAFEALVQFYRDENLLARAGKAEPPAYFRYTPTFDTTLPLDVNLAEMRNFVEEQHRLAARVLSPSGAAGVVS